MDVKAIWVVLVSLILAACGSPKNQPTNAPFSKPDFSNCETLQIKNEYLVKWKSGKVTLEKAKSDKAFIKDFIEVFQDEIQLAEPHYRIQGFSLENFQPAGFGGEVNWGQERIHATDAWTQGYRGQGVIVAVIDSGFDADHDELQGVLAINEAEELNDKDDDGNGLVDDRFGYDFVGRSHKMIDRTGHGTHVSGIIVANHEVGKINGIAPDAKLLPLNFIDETGSGSINSAINAIRYAAFRGAKVINASWGGEYCSLALKQEMKDLEEKNIIFVSAAGNSGKDLDKRPEYPAAFTLNNHISVGASTFSDRTAGFSNYGSPVSVVAPGANIISTIPKDYDTPICESNDPATCVVDGLAALDGTSMAAPFVTAAVAVLWSAKPTATYTEIKNALLQSVNVGPYPVSTRGRIDLGQALAILASPSP